MKKTYKFKFKIPNPIYKLYLFFNYNPLFWKLKKIPYSQMSWDGISCKQKNLHLIRHVITGKILFHDGWGDKVSQDSIYNVNEKYELMS